MGEQMTDDPRVATPTGETFLWSVLDAAADGVLVVDGEGRIRLANAEIEDLFGVRRRDLVDQPVEMLIPEDLRDRHVRHRAGYAQDPHGRPMGAGLDLRGRRADGSEIWVEVSLSPVRDGGRLYTVVIVRDVSARVDAERQLRESEQALGDAERFLAVAEDRERIARDLHDTVIQRLFAAGLELNGVAATAEGGTRERIEGVIDELDTVIREIRTSIFSLQGVERSSHGVRGQILDVLTAEGAALGIEPRLELDGAIEGVDDAIVTNLLPTLREALSNVARHARAREVRVVVAVSDDVTLTVLDDGVGVPREVLGGRGTGNMRSRAESLGGSCTLTNRDRGGARLHWCVPAARSAD